MCRGNRLYLASAALQGAIVVWAGGGVAQPLHATVTFANADVRATEAILENRLAELREVAEEEGIQLSQASEEGLRMLVRELDVTARPSIFLLENGNLRAVWKNLTGEQIGLQFLGANSVQLVFFVLREDGTVGRLVGKDTVLGAAAQVRSLGLLPLTRA